MYEKRKEKQGGTCAECGMLCKPLSRQVDDGIHIGDHKEMRENMQTSFLGEQVGWGEYRGVGSRKRSC